MRFLLVISSVATSVLSTSVGDDLSGISVHLAPSVPGGSKFGGHPAAHVSTETRMRELLGVVSNEELNTLLNRRISDPIDATNPAHVVHSELSGSLWGSETEYIPVEVFEAAGGDLYPTVKVGCFGGFCKRPRIPLTPTDGKIMIHLLSPLHKATRTGVYPIRELPRAVIKYFAWCRDETEPIDPIVIEGFFMEKLSRLNIAPKVFYYSDYFGYSTPPSHLPRQLVTNSSFEKTRVLYDGDCRKVLAGPHPSVRYMIMERLGDSLAEYGMSKQRSFLNAMKLGGQMVSLMKKLHSHNIVHGDAHYGNFVFRCNDVRNPACGDVVIIDFGRTKLLTVTGSSSVPNGCYDHVVFYHPFASKWEMKGCTTAFRDDVYRVVLASAVLMYKDRLFEHIAGLTDEGRIRLKRNANFFEIRDASGEVVDKMGLEHIPIGVWRKPALDAIRGWLQNISEVVSRENINWFLKPNYDSIIDDYRTIVLLLDPSLARKPDQEIFRIKRT
jgi:hypothetical protein